MDDILASSAIGNGSTLHIATLSKETVLAAGAEHLGLSGYFLFETNDTSDAKGINILCKVSSIEAGFRLIELWSNRLSPSEH